MTVLYGIPNCDTIKKVRKWFEANGIEYRFHDFRKDGIDTKTLKQWVDELGWETLVNRRGLTWRKLTDEQKASLNEKNAIQLMLEQPAIIKRPVLALNKKHYVGFKEAEYRKLFS